MLKKNLLNIHILRIFNHWIQDHWGGRKPLLQGTRWVLQHWDEMQSEGRSFFWRSPPPSLLQLVWNPTRTQRSRAKAFNVTSVILISKLRMVWKSTKGSPIRKFPLLKRRGGHPPNPLWFCPPSGTKAGWNLATTVAWKCPRPTNANMIKTSHWMRKLKWKHHRLVQDTLLTVLVAAPSGYYTSGVLHTWFHVTICSEIVTYEPTMACLVNFLTLLTFCVKICKFSGMSL